MDTLVTEKVEALLLRCPWLPSLDASPGIACTHLAAAATPVAFGTDEMSAFITTYLAASACAHLLLGGHVPTSPLYWAPHHVHHAARSLATAQLVHQFQLFRAFIRVHISAAHIDIEHARIRNTREHIVKQNLAAP
tara:strand:+ start:925 stop:1332 length:408 start_codon:yes stop_codon:yes gene_type:complete